MILKKNPRIIILGIDGLEFNLVQEWKLKNILQKKCCKLELTDYNVIVTPPIWGSMLTGKIDKEIMKIWEKQAEIMGFNKDGKQSWWAKIGKKLPNKLNYWIWDYFFKHLIGGDAFEKTSNYVLDKDMPNIFQFFKKTWTNGIPSYGKNIIDSESKKLTENAIGGDKLPFKKYVLEEYRNDKSELCSIINKEQYELIFWYTGLLDKLGHMYMGDALKSMMKYYLEINQIVGKVRDSCPDSKIYIISDHGMERMDQKKSSWGIHSNHGFFSSNTGEIISKPFHLYKLVSKYRRI